MNTIFTNFLRGFSGFVLLVINSVSGAYEEPALIKPNQAAVATAHPLATEAALEILAQGGNAFDAAVAATAALAVVEPQSSGLGGGGFYLLQHAKDKSSVMLDAREKAPLAAHANMYLSAKGEVNRHLSMNGALAAGIPGVPAALEHLASSRGVLSLSKSLAPAIKLAKEGFITDKRNSQMLKFRLAAIKASPAASNIFLQDGQVPDAGVL